MTTARMRATAKITGLSRSSDFGRVYAVGESKPGRLLVVWRYLRSDEGSARVGVVASKRALGKAHDRNRAKRLLRESARLEAGLFLSGTDYVLIARRLIRDANVHDVIGDMRKALARLP